MQKHRHQEFIRFLNKINRATSKHLALHLIVDNYAAHKTPEVKRWLKRHPRFHLHFTPTSASWLNLVERFFAEITRKRIRRGVFHSIVELQMAINDYLDQHNADPKPFAWTASASSIIDKVNRGKQALESLQGLRQKHWPRSCGIDKTPAVNHTSRRVLLSPKGDRRLSPYQGPPHHRAKASSSAVLEKGVT